MKSVALALTVLSAYVATATAADAQDDPADAVRQEVESAEATARGDTPDTSQQVDPSVQKFDKDGNPNYDADGNYIGCHGLGCKVDNPDTKTDADADGGLGSRSETRTMESRSSSSSIGLFSRPRNNMWSVDSVVGDWKLGSKEGGSTCSLTLFPDESFGLRRAWTSVGCPQGFFSVSGWRAAGRDLQLTDGAGSPIGSFRQVGPGRFEGVREKDGATMYLSR